MTDQAIETRLSRVETGQTELQAWRQEMQEAQREAWRRGEDLDRRLRETDRLIERTSTELGRMIKELGKQIGGLGDKFGGFTEGMALPSMQRQLAERFGTTGFAVRPRVRIGGEELEVEAIAYSVGEAGTVCLVEVKSRLRDDGIDQILRALRRFPRFFPEHRGKRLIGVLAAVDVREAVLRRALREGLVLARIRDDVFELQIPEDYEPRSFPNPAPTGGADA